MNAVEVEDVMGAAGSIEIDYIVIDSTDFNRSR
jgi:hypothetical protein